MVELTKKKKKNGCSIIDWRSMFLYLYKIHVVK